MVQVSLTGSSALSRDSGIQGIAAVRIHYLEVLHFNLGMRNEEKSREGTLALNCLGLEVNQVTSAYIHWPDHNKKAPPN